MVCRYFILPEGYKPCLFYLRNLLYLILYLASRLFNCHQKGRLGYMNRPILCCPHNMGRFIPGGEFLNLILLFDTKKWGNFF